MGDVEATISDTPQADGETPSLTDLSASAAAAARPADRGQRPPPKTRTVVDHGDLDMRIARDGTWFYRGTPINRQALVKLFATVLRRDDDGGYSLVTPVERGRVTVEDAPFLAVEVNSEGAGRDRKLSFRTNLDEIVAAGPDHPLRIEVSANDEPERPVFYELVDLADAERGDAGGPFGLWSGGLFFDLGDPEDE